MTNDIMTLDDHDLDAVSGGVGMPGVSNWMVAARIQNQMNQTNQAMVATVDAMAAGRRLDLSSRTISS